jgi:putative peptidoglycan lipid II flippase
MALDLESGSNNKEIKYMNLITLNKYKQFINKIVSSSTAVKIFVSIFSVGSITIVVNLVTMVKDLAVASYFGVGHLLDAYLIALLIPSFLVSIFSGALNTAFIPVYIDVKSNNGEEAAHRLFSQVILFTAVLMSAISLILLFSWGKITSIMISNYSASQIMLVNRLFFILLFYIPLSAIVSILVSILNAEKYFIYTAVTSIFIPLSLIVMLFIGYKRIGIFALAGGMVIGTIIQLLLLTSSLNKLNIRMKFCNFFRDKEFFQVVRQGIPALLGSLVMSSSFFIDQSMAAKLVPGSVSILSYGNKIIAFILSLGVTSIGTVAFPYFSEMVSKKKWNKLRKSLNLTILLVFIASIPVVIIIMSLSTPIVKLFFQRGAFSGADTSQVAKVQIYFALQIPFYIAGGIVVKLISAFQMNKLILILGVINFIDNIVFNIVFSKYMGVSGIALSTSVVYFLSCIMIIYVVYYKLTNYNINIHEQ